MRVTIGCRARAEGGKSSSALLQFLNSNFRREGASASHHPASIQHGEGKGGKCTEDSSFNAKWGGSVPEESIKTRPWY